jgi:hypothetical protein
VSELPAKGTVAAAEAGKLPSLGGAAVRRLILTRHGTDERVPALLATPAGWNGTVLVWADGRGKDAVLGESAAPGVRAAVEGALAGGAAVLAPDVLLTGELLPASGTPEPPLANNHEGFHGYTYGYNRTPLANRVRDVLTAIGHARGIEGARRVMLVGTGDGGLWALLALPLCEGAVERTIVEGPAFDLGDVKRSTDLRFLPGGVKYGGWGAFAAAAAPAELRLASVPAPAILTSAYAAAGQPSRLMTGAPGIEARAIEELLR